MKKNTPDRSLDRIEEISGRILTLLRTQSPDAPEVLALFDQMETHLEAYPQSPDEQLPQPD